MTTVVVVVTYAVALFMIVAIRHAVGGVAVAFLFQQGLVAVGLVELSEGAWTLVFPFVGMSIAWSIGYAVTVPAAPGALDVPRPGQTRRMMWFAVTATISAVLGTAYHFSVVGLPLLSPDIARDRWDFTASGLLGIPSRMLLFGLPVAVATWLVLHRHVGTKTSRAWMIGSSVFWAAARLGTGFRGALVEVAVLFGLWVLLQHRVVSRKTLMAVALCFVGALAGVATLSGQYEGVADEDPVTVVGKRLTTGAALPIFRLSELSDQELAIRSTLAIESDVRATLSPILRDNEEAAYSFAAQLSAAMHDRDLGGDAFIVPVTIGASAALLFDFGVGMGLLCMTLLGFATAQAEKRAIYGTRVEMQLISLVSLVIIFYYVVRGNLPFYLANYAATLGLLSVVALVASPMRRLRPLR